MEKGIIIDFLHEHWEEFAALLSGTADATVGRTLTACFPDDLCEFANLLSKLISAYRTHEVDEQSQSPVHENLAFCNSLHSAVQLDTYDTKGLLEKARQLRKTIPSNRGEEQASIIVKNGLFTVQPQQYNETLNTSFKTLVDSVL